MGKHLLRNSIEDMLLEEASISPFSISAFIRNISAVQIEHDEEITRNLTFVRNMISWPIMAIRGSIRPTDLR